MARKRSDGRRSDGACLYLVSAESTVIRAVKRDYGEARVADGSWQRMFQPNGQHVGYQACDVRLEGGSASNPSSCVISRREMEMIAGLHGASRTAAMNEEQKQLRVVRIRKERYRFVPADDAIECAHVKRTSFLSSANVNGDKAVRVYPKG